MKNLFCFRAGAIRAQYSRHVLRAHAQGFAPMSLPRFVAIAAPVAFDDYINSI